MKILSKRKSEMWVSNNRVLVGGSKKITGRNPNFDTDETKLLISLWGDPKIQKTLITTHKKHAVIAKLAEKMREYGYHRSAEEINTRIKNLKCFYNRIKKDQESGGQQCLDPSWKHYAAMDEIMTRPIFSVRPNEIPKPSLRYRLEEARREREELQKQSSFGSGVSTGGGTSNNNIDIDDISDNENAEEKCSSSLTHDTNSQSHNDADEEMIECFEEKPKLKELDICNKDNNSNCSSDIEDTTINIKDEPIEVDDDNDEIPSKEKDDDEADMFPLSEYLKLTNNKTGNGAKIITTITSAINKESTPVTTSQSLLKLSQPTFVLSNNNKTGGGNIVQQQPTQQGKISLVPTNFLMKTSSSTASSSSSHQQQQIQLRNNKAQHASQQQHRIIYTQSGSQANTGIMNTNNGPMKVLLVNTLQKNGGSGGPQQNNVTAVNPTATGPIIQQQKPIEIHQNKTIFTAPTIQTNANHQQQQRLQKPTTVNLSSMVSSTNVDKINLITSSKNPTGYRALLGQLIKVQAEGNDISRQRLQIERERLKFEQSLADRFFASLPNLTNVFTNFVQNQEQNHHQQQKEAENIQLPAPILLRKSNENNFTMVNGEKLSENEKHESIALQLLTPKIEKED